jgi:hypothetical protein
MKKDQAKDPDLPDEVDFSNGVRGEYAERFGGGRNIVVLEADVAKLFPDSASVNQALRALSQMIAQMPSGDALQAAKPKRRSKVKASA